MGKLEGPSEITSGGPVVDCPQPTIWFSIATGLLPNTRAVQFLNHAGQCRFCATLLKNAMEDVAGDEPTPETQQNLKSAQKRWQEDLAREMDLLSKQKTQESSPVAGKGKPGIWNLRPAWLYAAAAAVVAVASGSLFWLCSASPESLLRKAYTQERTVEIRLAKTEYTPYLVQRGAASSRMNRTPALQAAEDSIERELEKHANNATALQNHGRAELLRWDYKSAIQDFHKAQDIEAETVSLKLDLASAYFERAELSGNRTIDYTRAHQLLGEILASNPDDQVGLFNHAIVSEHLFFFHEETSDWERYLQLDPKGGWAEEARQHLSYARERLAEYGHKRAEPLLTPAEFVQHVDPADEKTWGDVDRRIEEYLGSAVQEWLPQAFPASPVFSTEQPALQASAALRRLGVILARRHDDLWLTDMMKAVPSPAFSRGVMYLSQAVARNAAGDADTAGKEAREAARLFRQARSIPGVLRAQLAIVYALHRGSQGSSCLEAIVPLDRLLDGKRYSWMQSQLLLEKHTCFRITGDFKNADLTVASARAKADAAGFGSLVLRAIGFEASLNWSVKGNEARAWSLYREGLDRFWSGNYPAVRAYEFYAELCSPAENHRYWQLALGCSAEAAAMAAQTDDSSLKALSYFRVSNAALMAGKAAQSKAEQKIAQELFAALPSGPAKESYLLETEIRNAGIEAEQGQQQRALARLNAVESRIYNISNDFILLHYFQELGDVKRKVGDLKGADQSYRAAIARAEVGFAKATNRVERTGWQAGMEAAYRGLAETQSLTNNAVEALETWESYRAVPLWEAFHGPVIAQPKPALPASLIRKTLVQEIQPAAPFQLRPALALLGKETILSYAMFSNGLAIWAYDNRGITSRFVPVSRDELERVVRRFSGECADLHSDLAALQRDGQTLYQWLIAPVESRLDPSRIVVVEPDGVLDQVAIQALVDSKHEYFGTRYSVAFTPGLEYYLQGLHAKEINADSRALVIGSSQVPTDYLEVLQPLPDAIRESQIVGGILGRSRVLDGEEMTAKELLHNLAHVEIFHFAGHAVATAEGMRLVLTSSDGGAQFIDANVFRRPEFKDLQLVVLSACSTAQSGENDSVGSGNLIEALLETGVPRAIGSYWNLDSKTTVPLIQTLYQGIAAGKPVSLALHDAQLKSRAANSHPYYWATFHIWI